MSRQNSFSAGLMLCLTAGCGLIGGPDTTPDTQSFTRSINATPSRVVEATVEVFAERGITVATSDQTEGEVVSVPLNPTGQWGSMAPIERVNCDDGQYPDPDARLILTVTVKGESARSVMSVNAKHEGDNSCVLRSTFLTGLMDAIAARAAPGGS